jgi:hypothetical protein
LSGQHRTVCVHKAKTKLIVTPCCAKVLRQLTVCQQAVELHRRKRGVDRLHERGDAGHMWCGHGGAVENIVSGDHRSLPFFRHGMVALRSACDGIRRALRSGTRRAMGRPRRVTTTSPSREISSSSCVNSLRTCRMLSFFMVFPDVSHLWKSWHIDSGVVSDRPP